MPLFDGSNYVEFNGDDAVLRHEIGHAAIWFCLAEGVGPLRFNRRVDGQLMARVALWPRTGGLEMLLSREYATPYAERLIAGELAARRYLGLRTDEICSKGLPVDAPSNYLAGILAQADDKEDIVKILKLALNGAQSGWRNWLGERLNNANVIVDANWNAIDQVAKKFKGRLPSKNRSKVLAGADMILQMERYGMQSEYHSPVEIVFKGHAGGFVTRLKRRIRQRGSNGMICRYEDDWSEGMRNAV